MNAPIGNGRIFGLTLLLLVIPAYWAWPAGLDFWRGAGILLGWLGSSLLLASLLLMLREPHWAAWLGGLERMYRWHHRFGVLGYVLLLAHPLCLALSGWQTSPQLAWQTVAPWAGSWPLWLGWTALLLLMLGLACALLPARHLAYAHWRLLHGLLALAVILAASHLLLLGLNTALLFLPLLAVGTLLWRALFVDLGLAARPYRVQALRRVGLDTLEVLLQPLQADRSSVPDAVAAAAQPGQFVLVAFFDGAGFHGCREYHPFTLSAVEPSGLRITIKALGNCTRTMQQLVAGTAARVQGPFGIFLPARQDRPAFWLAGGIGITPFIAALRHAPLTQKTRLLYFYRQRQDAAYLEELQVLAENQPLLQFAALATGNDRTDLDRHLPTAAALAGSACYLCGPPALVAAVISALQARGVAAAEIHSERFDFR